MDNSIFSILRKKFPEREYALMEEVSDAAGFNRSRSADFVLMNLWPSRGLYLHGIELKSHRNDWLSELKNPKKAENIFQYCDYFSLLTENENIAKLEEIPATWGWMSIRNGKIIILKEAPKLSPKEMTRSFLASMLKRASCKDNYIRKEDITAEIEAAHQRGFERSEKQYKHSLAMYEQLQKNVKDFYIESDIDLSHRAWRGTPQSFGKAVRFIEQGGVESTRKELLSLKETAERIVANISSAVDHMEQVINFKKDQQ